MTQLDSKLADALFGNVAGSEGSHDEDAGSEGSYSRQPVTAFDAFEDAVPGDLDGDLDIEELCDGLQGLPPDDAETEAREALRKAGGKASDADTLGILLRVFRLNREAALQGYQPWDVATSYCDHLTAICDKNFVGAAGGEATTSDFPPSIVAAVYAESGRTLALANKLLPARNRLEKALNVFQILTNKNDERVQLQEAGAKASLARVVQRLGHIEIARGLYLQTLESYTKLPVVGEVADLIGEVCEVLGAEGSEFFTPALPGVLMELSEAKLGSESKEHVKVLQDIIDACTSSGQPELSGAPLLARARALRSRCDSGVCGALALAEAEAAEEEAAQALEAAVPSTLEKGDIEGAAALWDDAMLLRMSLEGPDSPLVAQMQATSAALHQAAADKAAHEGTADSNQQIDTQIENTLMNEKSGDTERERVLAERPEEVFIERTKRNVDDTSDDEAEYEDFTLKKQLLQERSAAGGVPHDSGKANAVKLSGSALTQKADLRPAWARPSMSQPVDDGWDS